MNNLEIFYFAAVSLEMNGAFSLVREDGEPVFLQDDETYFNPSYFENHLKTVPATFWPREFRRASTVIKERAASLNGEQWEGVPVSEILGAALVCLYDMAREMVPEMAEELEPETPQEKPRAPKMPDYLPPEIVTAADNDTITALFGALELAGYLDHDWKPTSSAPTNRDKAFMARALAQLLGVYEWPAAFSRYWGVPNLSAQASQAKMNGTRRNIEKVLADAVANLPLLKVTTQGQTLLKNYILVSNK